VYDACERTVEFSLVARIARDVSELLAGDVDEYPAHYDPNDSGQLNRASRIMNRTINSTIVPRSEDLVGVLTWAVNRIARQRVGGRRS
jgi:hypothetical protein